MNNQYSHDVSIEVPLINRILRIIGYVFVALGIISIIVMLVIGFSVRSNPILQTNPQLFQGLFLTAITPFIIGAVIMFIIGVAGLYAGKTKSIPKNDSIRSDSSYQKNESNLLERLSRLENIVDNNFDVMIKRLDKIEEQQKIASQNTIIKAKKE